MAARLIIIFIGAGTLLFYALVHEVVSKNNNIPLHNEIINQSSPLIHQSVQNWHLVTGVGYICIKNEALELTAGS